MGTQGTFGKRQGSESRTNEFDRNFMQIDMKLQNMMNFMQDFFNSYNNTVTDIGRSYSMPHQNFVNLRGQSNSAERTPNSGCTSDIKSQSGMKLRLNTNSGLQTFTNSQHNHSKQEQLLPKNNLNVINNQSQIRS